LSTLPLPLGEGRGEGVANITLTSAPANLPSPDWTGWRGPNRDGLVPWLPDRLPKTPNIVWRTPLAAIGIGGVAATSKYVLVTDREFDDAFDVLRCLDAATGKEIWTHRYPAPGMLDYGNSPRATPLIEDGKCWLLGAHGNLSCVELETGREVWQIDVKSDFGLVEPLKWGLCGSPLLVDRKLILYVGGPQAAIVALDPATGKPVWKTPGNPPGYGSLNVGSLGGKRQLVGHDATALAGWDFATGKQLWSLKPPIAGDFNVPTPIIWNNHLLVATENNGTRMFKFDDLGVIVKQPVATLAELAPDTHSPLAVSDRLFGTAGDLYCLDLKNSLKVLWKGPNDAFFQHTSLIASPERLLISTSTAELLLVDARAAEYKLLGRMKVLDNEAGLLAHPAIVGKRLYFRGSHEIVCVDLSP
jgi:outer membrane protein assembly factor BamB